MYFQKILTAKVANHDNPLFELPYTEGTTVVRYVEVFYQRMVAQKRIDVLVEKKEKKASQSGKDLQMIDLNSIRNKDVREIGAEWLSYQAMRQLQIAPFLESLGWSEDQVRLAQTHLISRVVYPASELKTTRWIKEKRSDAKLVVLGLVINPEGFIKYSSILEGNMADSKTLEGMINK